MNDLTLQLSGWVIDNIAPLVTVDDELDPELPYHILGTNKQPEMVIMGSVCFEDIKQTVAYLRTRRFLSVFVVKQVNDGFKIVAQSNWPADLRDITWTDLAYVSTISRGTKITVTHKGRDYFCVVDRAENWGSLRELDPDWDIECHAEPGGYTMRLKWKYDNEHSNAGYKLRLGWQ